MSWNISTSGRDPKEVEDNLRKANEDAGGQMPEYVEAAINKTVDAFGARPDIERVFSISTYGHVDKGIGNASFAISVTEKPADATTAAGSRDLADRLKNS